MAITQPRASGGLTGRRYGSFAGRGDGSHPVDALTQPRAVAAYTGKRYGSFEGRGEVGHPVGRLTQPRAHSAYTGRRYGSFAGRAAVVPPDPQPQFGGGFVRMRVPDHLRRLQRLRLIEDEEMIAWLIAALPGLTRH